MGQGALEQARNDRADRVAIVDHDIGVLRAQPLDLRAECRVIRIEEAGATLGDLFRIRLGARRVERLAVEGGGGAQLRRRLARIERDAGRDRGSRRSPCGRSPCGSPSRRDRRRNRRAARSTNRRPCARARARRGRFRIRPGCPCPYAAGSPRGVRHRGRW